MPPIEIGSIVLISEDNKPRLFWPTGIVVETYKGKDGLVKSTLIRIGKNTTKRLIKRLHRLEVQIPTDDISTDLELESDELNPPVKRL